MPDAEFLSRVHSELAGGYRSTHDSQDEAIESLARDIKALFPQWPDCAFRREGNRWVAYAADGELCFRGESSESQTAAHHDLGCRIAAHRGDR